MRTPIAAVLLRFLGRLKFPTLFKLTAAFFLLDLFIPDLIPFADELLLGLATILFSQWRKPKDAVTATDNRVIDHETRR
ncbi:DUF6116 family protein [Luteimonas sp. FXH3W]|uniref:DUF6116 family protein n=1 Tax=Aquilutibacter rugosus TaxID=3115820 RepID=A0ABU7V0R4_9GAMM